MTRRGALLPALALGYGCAGAPPVANPPVGEHKAPVTAARSAPSAPCPIPPFPYLPLAPSTVEASLPLVPPIPDRPIRIGDAYSVWGASYSLRSRAHVGAVRGKELTVRGYIIKTNVPEAPHCVVHAAGQADPVSCRAPTPAFWLADDPNARVEDAIKVMGWSSNYAQIFEAIRVYDSAQGGSYDDVLWGQTLPNPLPAVGAQVTVTGTYGTTFTKTTSGIDSDPDMGILDYRAMEYLAPAPELATLPGVRRKKR